MVSSAVAAASRGERIFIGFLFILALLTNVLGLSAGWKSLNLPGEEFRQAQTALSTYFIHKDQDFSLAYPTPVLGKPWSIPMEFPLYQWTVAGWMNLTGMEITQSGRLVSVACFYLTLPAVFLLLGQLGIGRWHRLLVVGLILVCPLYIFYVRGFFIETMALMASVWFLTAFIAAVKRQRWGWLMVANLAGIIAGGVKVTTFMLYLMPAGVLSLIWLWRARKERREWLRVVAWVVGACLLPFVATVAWTHYADTVKALNPAGAFLQSEQLSGFNFGTSSTRFAASVWRQHWDLISTYLIWLPAIGLCAAGLLLVKGGYRTLALWSFSFFMAVQLLFPVLYALHGYYYMANGLFLMGAMGFLLIGLLLSRAPKWLSYITILAVFSGQSGVYFANHYTPQKQLSYGGNGLSAVLKHVTDTNDVLIEAGDDWSSLTPFFSRRRALMIRADIEKNGRELDALFGKLKGERIGALILMGESRDNKLLLHKTVAAYGLDPRPLLIWKNARIYFRHEDWSRIFSALEDDGFDEVSWADGITPPTDPLPQNQVLEYANLSRLQKKLFAGMNPRPTRVYGEFGTDLTRRDGVRFYGMHPNASLWFKPEVGPRVLTTTFMIAPDAYQRSGDKTDGVLLIIKLHLKDGTSQRLQEQFLDPANWAEDRGIQAIKLDVNVPEGAEIEISTEGGPHGNKAKDWAWLGDVEIK